MNQTSLGKFFFDSESESNLQFVLDGSGTACKVYAVYNV